MKRRSCALTTYRTSQQLFEICTTSPPSAAPFSGLIPACTSEKWALIKPKEKKNPQNIYTKLSK